MSRFKHIFLAVVLPIAVSLSGCTFHYNTMQQSHLSGLQIQPLTPEQYEILGDVKGSGKATYFLFFEVNNQTQYAGEIMNGGWSISDWFVNSAYRMAHFQAIKSAKGADALIAPRYEVQTWGAPWVLTTTTVTVYAKAIRLKSIAPETPAAKQ
ncbi:MAG: hypothetical protein VKN33_09425 [Candidatus Sericytochromatia bacterium]|nr:hypothetical protein [Candidatus Sericytochromatia bacterium]